MSFNTLFLLFQTSFHLFSTFLFFLPLQLDISLWTFAFSPLSLALTHFLYDQLVKVWCVKKHIIQTRKGESKVYQTSYMISYAMTSESYQFDVTNVMELETRWWLPVLLTLAIRLHATRCLFLVSLSLSRILARVGCSSNCGHKD